MRLGVVLVKDMRSNVGSCASGNHDVYRDLSSWGGITRRK